MYVWVEIFMYQAALIKDDSSYFKKEKKTIDEFFYIKFSSDDFHSKLIICTKFY